MHTSPGSCGDTRLERTTSLRSSMALVVLLAGPVFAQTPVTPEVTPAALTATPTFPSDRFVAGDTPIGFTLSRALDAAEGRLALVVGGVDVTPVADRTPTSITYRPRPVRLRAGEGEAVAYLVAGGRWSELVRVPLKVLTAGGFTTATATPAISLNNKGQLAEGHSGDFPTPERPRYQDFTASSGLQTAHARNGWAVRSQVNLLGASRQEEALRFGVRGEQAPQLDLADYQLQFQRGGTSVALGHVSAGSNRHLVSGFASRGVTAGMRSSVASLDLSAMNGSSIAGWDNPLGMANDEHRIYAATAALELRPKRPGALHVDATLLDGSLLPEGGFTQGALLDAERSTGAGLQLSASIPSQRLRLSAGVSRSRFDNPARDPELQGDTILVAVRRETRGARYLELNADLLQNSRLARLFATSLSAAFRHERIDPMYRSVASYAQADRRQDAVDVTATLGAMSVALGHSRSNDNLARIASVLTTRSQATTASASTALASLFGVTARANLLPQLTYSASYNRQFGDGIPVNSDFAASSVPDQRNTVHDAAAAWATGRWQLQYRYSYNHQDNRQTGREKADFTGSASTATLSLALRDGLDASLDASAERQENRELAQNLRVNRLGGTLNWRLTRVTSMSGYLSLTSSADEPATSDVDTGEMRVELTRGFDLWRSAAGGETRGQLFLRFARQSALTRQLDALTAGVTPLPSDRVSWTLSSGASLRIF